MFRVCHACLSVHCSLVITCWERANLLAVLCVMFSCVVVTFPSGVLGQAWNLIVSIPNLCLLTYFAYGRELAPGTVSSIGDQAQTLYVLLPMAIRELNPKRRYEGLEGGGGLVFTIH